MGGNSKHKDGKYPKNWLWIAHEQMDIRGPHARTIILQNRASCITVITNFTTSYDLYTLWSCSVCNFPKNLRTQVHVFGIHCLLLWYPFIYHMPGRGSVLYLVSTVALTFQRFSLFLLQNKGGTLLHYCFQYYNLFDCACKLKSSRIISLIL